MADQESILGLRATGAENVAKSLDKTGAGLVKVDNAIKRLKKSGNVVQAVGGTKSEQQNLTKVHAELQKELEAKISALKDIEKQLKSTADLATFRKMKEDAGQAQSEVVKLERELKEVDRLAESVKKKSSGRAQYKQLASTVIQSVQGAGGVGGAGGSLAESLGIDRNSQAALSEFADTIQSAVPFLQEASGDFSKMGGAIGNVIKGTTSAKEGLGTVVSSLGSVGVIGALVGATLAVWGKVFQMLADREQQAREEVDNYVEALKRKIELERQINDFITTGDLGGAQAALEDAKKAREDALAVEADLRQRIAANEAAYANLGGALDPGRRRELIGEHDELLKQLQDSIVNDLGPAVQQVDSLMRALPDVANSDPVLRRLQGYMQQMPQNATAVENLKSAESDLIQTRQTAAEAVKQFEDQLRQQQLENAVQAQRQEQDRAIADERAAKDQAEALQQIQAESNKALEQLAKEHDKTLMDLQISYAKESENAAQQLAKSLLSIDTNLAKSVAEATAQYQKDQAKSLAAFRKEQARAEAEYQKERKRRLEDAQQSLLEAEMNNDVVAFIQAQASAKKDLSRMAEDRADSRAQAAEDFKQQQDEARQAFEENLQQMREQAAEQKQQTIDQYNEEKAQRDQQFAEQKQLEAQAFAERLQQQKDQTNESLAVSAAAFAKQQQLQAEDRALEDQRRKEDQEKQLQQQTEALNEQLDEAKKHEADLLKVLRSGGNDQLDTVTLAQTQIVSAYQQGAQNAVAAVQAAMAAINSAATTTYGPPATGASTGSWGTPVPFVAAAKGVVTKKPTLVMTSENYQQEAVFPLDQSPGLPGGLGSTVNISGITIGAGNNITIDELTDALNELGEVVVAGIHEGRKK